MIQKVIAFMEKHNMISEHDLVAAGVSGGADSLCLLFVLLEYQKKIPFDLVVVHVNHLIREEAALDADFVKNICDGKKIPFYLKEADIKKIAKEQHLSEEEAGRKVRYEAFSEALCWHKKQESEKCIGECKIAVAHHQADSAETMLFHLFRGTGIYGMTGILPVNGNIIRPLLTCSRREIEEYLEKRQQKWCIDCTNEEDTYTRNKIRHHILGYADEKINEKATEHVAKAALQLASLREYLESEVEKMIQETAEIEEDLVSVKIEKLKEYPEFLQSQFLLEIINRMIPGRRDFGSEHIQGILDLLGKPGSKKMNLPKNLEVVKEYQILWIKKCKDVSIVDKGYKKIIPGESGIQNIVLKEEQEIELEIGKDYRLEDGSTLELSLINSEDLERIEEKKYTKYFDYDKINSCLKLRFRQTGDYLTINDRGQKKSLKEYFIHEKIPASMRYKIPVIADENHILWTIGYRISAYYKVTAETKKIVQMTIRRDEHVREN